MFVTFAYGLACTMGAVIICVWLMLSPEASVVCMSVTVYTAIKMYTNYTRVEKRFDFDESETVDFSDIFEGPANIQTVRQTRPRKRGVRDTKNVGMNGYSESFHSEEGDLEMMSLTANEERIRQQGGGGGNGNARSIQNTNRKRTNIPKPREGLEYCEGKNGRQKDENSAIMTV